MTWTKGPMIGFDVETTGVDVESDRIVTAAVVVVDSSGIISSRSWLVNPGAPIPDEAAAIHGVTSERAQAEGIDPAAAIAEIVDAIYELPPEVPLVAFNASFDLTILDRECRRHLGRPFGLARSVVDPFVIDRQIDPYRKGSRRLAEQCAHYGVPHNGAHNSSEDTLAALRLAWAFGHHPELGTIALPDLHESQIEWHRERQESFRAYLERQGKDASDVSTEWPMRLAQGVAT